MLGMDQAQRSNAVGFNPSYLPDGEGAKSTACFTQIVKALLKHDRWYRKIFIVCLGGGTIS